MPTIAQIFARTLKEIGVQFVFGVPSGNMIDYIEALREEEGIDFVLVGHEATASFMADVCGRLTGIPGVCFGTFGPGATNLSTGVGGALLDRSPLIAFTDEMPDHLLNRTVQMNINHQQLFFPITKYTIRLTGYNIEEVIQKAAGIACEETPGSVHIGLPAGKGQKEIPENILNVEYKKEEKNNLYPQQTVQFDIVTEQLEMSKKPILAIGLAAVRTGVKSLIFELANKLNIPVVLTPMAKGMFPESHPLYAGVLFHALSNTVAEIYSKADVVIGIGYDPVEFNYEDWMPRVPLIHFDLKEADVDVKQIPKVFNVIGNLEITVPELLNIYLPKTEWELDDIQNHKTKLFEKLAVTSEKFGPLAVVHKLRKALPYEGILTVDVGAHLHLIGQQWYTPEPDKLLMTNGWSSMGFAIPAAVAAKLCNPDLPVAAIMGDGGFTMMAGELATVKRMNLKIVFVVLYDNSLSLIRIKQKKKDFDSQYGTNLNVLPDEPTNHYFGVPVIRAACINTYEKALEEAFEGNGPVVIEALIDGSEYDELVLKPNK